MIENQQIKIKANYQKSIEHLTEND